MEGRRVECGLSVLDTLIDCLCNRPSTVVTQVLGERDHELQIAAYTECIPGTNATRNADAQKPDQITAPVVAPTPRGRGLNVGC